MWVAARAVILPHPCAALQAASASRSTSAAARAAASSWFAAHSTSSPTGVTPRHPRLVSPPAPLAERGALSDSSADLTALSGCDHSAATAAAALPPGSSPLLARGAPLTALRLDGNAERRAAAAAARVGVYAAGLMAEREKEKENGKGAGRVRDCGGDVEGTPFHAALMSATARSQSRGMRGRSSTFFRSSKFLEGTIDSPPPRRAPPAAAVGMRHRALIPALPPLPEDTERRDRHW